MMARQTKQTPTSPSLRERAVDAYDNARDRASAARAWGAKGVSDSPILVLGGGLALGALVAALLPRTRTEERLIGKVGTRIATGARGAFDAAREAGRERLAELDITPDAGASAIQSLVDGLGEAARSSGRAAAEAIRGKG